MNMLPTLDHHKLWQGVYDSLRQTTIAEVVPVTGGYHVTVIRLITREKFQTRDPIVSAELVWLWIDRCIERQLGQDFGSHSFVWKRVDSTALVVQVTEDAEAADHERRSS